VTPQFGPRDYPTTFAALQEPSAGKLLDLVPVRLLCADIFEDLAAAWTAGPDAVPRLGILLSFERWVMLRPIVANALEPLAARGVRVEVFYAEQAAAGYLGGWFAHGQVVHNVPGAIATLAAHWHPSESWPLVINTLCRLARAHTSAPELPGLLTQLAALALSCGGAVEAATLAREALYYLPETPSATRCQALRELGTALICQEQTSAGLALLDQAFTMAAQVKAPDVGASALCHSGLCSLNHGDYAGAERRFRHAIALLSNAVRRPHLLALAHHSLAVALMRQGSPEAEHHARTALALRPDPDSHLAEEDRLLLAKLRELRDDGARNGPRVDTPALASEADV
jgi:tetratricopeptide (TPR) repeat protein